MELKSVRKRTLCVALNFVAAVGMIVPFSVSVFADSSGPGAPTASGCGGDANAKGPCTDPGTYSSSGTGNGLCGLCGNVVYSYRGGSCTGSDSVSANNCAECTLPKNVTRQYRSTPVGYLWLAGCLATVTACMGGDAAIAYVCGEACIVSGVFTMGQSCLLCLSGVGAVGAACTCAYNECVETCEYIATSTTGSTTACSNCYDS